MRLSKMLKRESLLTRALCLFIAHTFILSGLSFAAPQVGQGGASGPISGDDVVASPDKLVVSRDFGLIKSKYTGREQKLVVHIQDAHCNFEAQSNIVKILENLIRNYGLNLVSVEGAEGLVDTTWFKSFPDEDVRKEVATYFMKKGEITGPEFLSITSDYSFKLFGAETKQYYIENLNAFTSSYSFKDETEKYYSQIKTILNRLKGHVYTEELKEFDSKHEDYESKRMTFNDYIRYLEALCETHSINIRAHDNFFKLISTLIYEKKIDFAVVDKERNALIDELTKKLSKDAVQDLVMKSLTFKVGKITSAEYYTYLRQVSRDAGMEIAKSHPNVSNYVIYTSVYSRIENEKLFQEIKAVEGSIKDKMFKNDEQRELDRMSHHANTILSLINIKLLNADFDYYTAHREEFTPQVFIDYIKREGAKYGFAYNLELPGEGVQRSIPKLEDFYRIAIKRDKAIVDNTLKAMDKNSVQLAVLVTGGFHTEGMTKLLEKEGVSYLVVSPNITKDVPTPYIQVLTNQKTPFEELLVGTAQASEGMLAPILRTSLSEGQISRLIADVAETGTIDRAELEKLAEGIKVTNEMFRGGWLSLHLSRWVGKTLRANPSYAVPSQVDIIEAYRQAFVKQAKEVKGRPLTEGENAAIKAVIESERFASAFNTAYGNVAPRVMREMRRAQPTFGTSGIRGSSAGALTLQEMEDDLKEWGTLYGDTALKTLQRMREVATPRPLVEAFVRTVYERRNNIRKMQAIIDAEIWEGYDVIIISSTTEDEAQYQKAYLERLLDGCKSDNAALNGKICILSVLDDVGRGQIPGQMITWIRACEAYKEWAVKNVVAEKDLDKLFRAGAIKPAIYHNGGMGERASPATQYLNLSRGAQSLVGDIKNKKGEPVPLELISAVVLSTSPLAITNGGSRIEGFWTNQLGFGTIDEAEVKRTNAAFDKLVVKIPASPKPRDLYDYGSAVISEDGRLERFLANRCLVRPDLTANPEYANDYDEMVNRRRGYYDFGSFSMSRDMHYALLDYWTERLPGGTDRIHEERPSRDIDPALFQILVPLANGLEGVTLPALPERLTSEEEFVRVYEQLTALMDAQYREALDKIYNDPKKREFVYESMDLFLKYRDTIFSDLTKVGGSIDLGENSYWFPYKRLLDMANEKFIMLTDMTGHTMELSAAGEAITATADAYDTIQAEDARMIRQIPLDGVCKFMVDGHEITLSRDEVRQGWQGYGVTVKDSIIQGNCELLPGSEIVNSVLNNSHGRIRAMNSYVESATAPVIAATNSIVYGSIDAKEINADKEIVADAYRPDIEDARFPKGQTRMRAPIGYDPKPSDEEAAARMSDKVRFGNNAYPFGDIREMPCNRNANMAIEDRLRIDVMRASSAGMQGALDKFVLSLARSGQLTPELADELLLLLSEPTRALILREQIERFKEGILQFGTSGQRGYVTQFIDVETRISTLSFLKYCEDIGEIKPGETVTIYIGGDLRSSTKRLMRSVSKAVADSGYKVRIVNCGRVPSPVLALYAIGKGPSIMITGSHIPDDMNGIKFTTKRGEILKSAEPAIKKYAGYDAKTGAMGSVREAVYNEWLESMTNPQGLFTYDGMYRGVPRVKSVDEHEKAVDQYVRRYLEAFPGRPLEGKRIVLYQHSAVGRDIVREILEGLGAEVKPVGRSPKFVAVDTENVTPETRAKLVKWAKTYRPFAVISTDGDSDRPLFADEKGEFLPGDKLGLLAVRALESMGATIDMVAFPITTNTGIVESLEDSGIETLEVRIGSPWVIQPLEQAREHGRRFVVGWECNGGFIQVSDLNVNGKTLDAVPTRDAAGPMIYALIAAAKQGISVSDLIAREMPKRYTHADLLDGIPRSAGQAITGSLVPKDDKTNLPYAASVIFNDANSTLTINCPYLDDFGRVLFDKNEKIVKPKEDAPYAGERARKFIEGRAKLETAFREAGIEGSIAMINFMDGIEVTLDNGDIVHFRSSGNADQFRTYSESESMEKAAELVRKGLYEVVPKLRAGVETRASSSGREAAEYTFRTWLNINASALPNVVVDELNAALTPQADDIKYIWDYADTIVPLARSLPANYADEAVRIQTIAGQALIIAELYNRGYPEAELIRLTVNPDEMIESPDKERTLILSTGLIHTTRSFVTAPALKQAEGEGREGIYWRGIEGINKLGDNINQAFIYDRGEWEDAAPNTVLYVMLHIGPSHHMTVFLTPTLPGSLQAASTGPGHAQGSALDMKRVLKGSVIQSNILYDGKGEPAEYMFQTAGEGEYFYSLPGFVDSCSADPLAQGAVIFEDVSLDAPQAAAAMGRRYGVDVNAKPANIVNMPYIVGTFRLTRQAETALVVNSPDAPNPKRMTVAVKPPVSSVGSFAKTPKPAQERVRKDVEDMVEEEALNARKVDLLNGAVNIFSMRASSAGRAGEEVTLDELERATINGVRGTYLETLNYVAEEANIEDGIVIVACDRSVYEGPNKGFRMMAREIVKNIGLELDLKKPGAVVFVEGSSQDALEEEITRAIDRAPDKRVRRVVTILNAEHRLTWNADKVFSEDLEGSIQRTPEDIAANRPGAVLMSVDLTELHKEWTPYKSTITLRGLYGIAINLGYGQLERAAIMYHLIDKDAPSIPEIMNMLAERIIRLIPRIAKVPIGDMPKAYQAAKQALVSL